MFIFTKMRDLLIHRNVKINKQPSFSVIPLVLLLCVEHKFPGVMFVTKAKKMFCRNLASSSLFNESLILGFVTQRCHHHYILYIFVALFYTGKWMYSL